MAPQFRAATHDDVPRLCELGLEMHAALGLKSWAAADAEFAAGVLHGLIDGAGFVGCACDGEKIIGYLAATMAPIWWAPSKVDLHEMHFWVSPEHRKSGAGKLLLDAAESWAKERKLDGIILTSEGSYMSQVLGKIYRARGYERSTVAYRKGLV